MGSRKYLCEFRDQCPEFNKMNIICRDKPWICGYWKIHVENLKKSLDSINAINEIRIPVSTGHFDSGKK